MVAFEEQLIEGRFVRRYKRFFADVELACGDVVTAHCANPGSMKTCAVEGCGAWISPAKDPKRKLKFTWELARVGEQMIMVNTHRANAVVESALNRGVVTELAGFDELRREVRYGEEKSRIDFLLTRGDAKTYVEVKSVTMSDEGDCEQNGARFPDSVTSRGAKHLRELMAMVDQGHRAVLLFSVGRSGVDTVRPADEIDPLYGETLRAAANAGVEILAYACDITPAGVHLRRRVPVVL